MNRVAKGFTLAEILVSMAIIALIFGIGTAVFVTARRSAALNTTTDSVVFMLEQAKNNALAGKNGTAYGIYFDTYSYTFFSGSLYNPSNPSNVPHLLDSGLRIAISLSAVGSTTVFARLTGIPSATGTIAVTNTVDSKTQTITVGNQGDISVVK